MYKESIPFEQRHLESRKVRQRYPTKVPIICEKDPQSSAPEIDKRKFLTPVDLSLGQFLWTIRQRIRLPPETALFLFFANSVPPQNATMGALYERHKDEDGFLYVTYSGENTFGR